MKKVILVTVLIAISQHFAIAQNLADQMLKKNGEVYFQFEINDHKDIGWLTNMVSIDIVKGTTVFAYANEKEFQAFQNTGIPYQLLPHPNESFQPVMKNFDEIDATTAWNYYPTYDAYVSLMYQFQTNYPSLCHIYSIGTSVQGRQLLVAKISDNVNTDEAEPEFYYTSSIHGDELTGYICMLHLMDTLLSSYGSVARITNLVNNIEIYINPLSNPDGTYHGGNNTVTGATRYNANSVDLNRNYPDPQNGPHPDGNAWQAENVAFMNFAESRHFVMSANFHGGAEVCNYPWDTKATLPADVNWWLFVCNEFADTVQAHSPSTYFTDLYASGVTNGYAWYEVNGGRQDYMNYFQQCREQTIEISDIKTPTASTLLNYWGYLRRSLLNYLQQSTYSLRGMITDANTGLPLKAEVYVVGHEADSSWVYSSPAGNYHRFLAAGNYNVRFSAPCYQTQTINNISVSNYAATNLNVQLVPNSNAVDFTASATSITIGGTVTFTDQSCGNPYSWLWSITGPGTPVYTGGTTNTSQNPIVQFNTAGSYTVSLTATSAGGTFTQTKTNYITVTSCSVCTSAGGNGTEEWISNVTFNTINNSSAVGTGYSNYTAISTTVTKGTTYTLSVTCGSTGTWTEHIWAFIDMNQDCDFADANESYDLGQTSGPGTKTLSITIPATATSGSTRLRVSLKYNADPTSCESFSYGEVEDYTLLIQVAGSPPVANFTANNTTPFIGQTVTFTDQSTNTPASWAWSFSPSTVTYTGGTNSASQNPQVQFTAGGSYSVTLTATNAYGSDPETKTNYISVVYAPVANFSANLTNPFIAQTVNFTDLSTNAPSSWTWSFNPATITYTGGTNAASQNPQVQFNAAGNYTVELIAANGSGNDSEIKIDYIAVQSLDFFVDLKVMLEGSFNGNAMNTNLNLLNEFPLSQPYSVTPWNYPGTENVAVDPENVVDWILVELRDATAATTATTGTRIARQAAFVMSNGTIKGLDGLTMPQFNGLTIQHSLFVVVWHRNHLPVLSSNPLIKSSNTYSFDFSSGLAQAYGSGAQKFLATGVYGLISGDANADGTINNTDKVVSWQTEAGLSGYFPSDLNLDGQSDNRDKNNYWMPNLGSGSQLP